MCPQVVPGCPYSRIFLHSGFRKIQILTNSELNDLLTEKSGWENQVVFFCSCAHFYLTKCHHSLTKKVHGIMNAESRDQSACHLFIGNKKEKLCQSECWDKNSAEIYSNWWGTHWARNFVFQLMKIDDLPNGVTTWKAVLRCFCFDVKSKRSYVYKTGRAVSCEFCHRCYLYGPWKTPPAPEPARGVVAAGRSRGYLESTQTKKKKKKNTRHCFINTSIAHGKDQFWRRKETGWSAQCTLAHRVTTAAQDRRPLGGKHHGIVTAPRIQCSGQNTLA